MAVAGQRWPIVGRRSDLEVFERALCSRRHAGLMIGGPPGVGKTRLADECRELAAADGHPVQRVVGSRTTASLPLGAVAGLLAAGAGDARDETSPAELFERTDRALRERHAGRRLVTVADDVPLLDAASAALLGFLAGRDTIFLIATARDGEPVPDALAGLARAGRLDRVELADLSAEGLDTLLHLALGGPMEAGAARQFQAISQGNPLYARELVLGGLESGALVERAGVWHLDGALPSTGRLRDLVGHRIGDLSPQARSVVELLAHCEPVGVDYLQAQGAADALELLQRAGLVAVIAGQVRLAHPLHAEVVRAGTPRLRARALLLEQAERLEAHSPGTAAVQAALWRLDAGGRPDPAILVHGAHLARYAHDFRLVRRLIEAVPDGQAGAAGALLLGEALYELGDFGAADEVLAAGQALPADESTAMRLAVIRAKNAQWGLCRPAAALEINAAARATVSSGPLAEELAADEAAIIVFSGQPGRAVAVLGDAGQPGSPGDRRTRVIRAIAAAVALATTGQTARAVTLAQEGFAEHMALGDELAIAHPMTHVINQVFALAEAGRLAEAEQVGRAGAEVAAEHRVPIAQIWFAANLGRVAVLQGKVGTGRRLFAEAAGLAQASGFAGPRRLALSGLALAHALLGEAGEAERVLAERDDLPRFGFLEPEQLLADAWAAVAAGRHGDAARHLLAAAEQARSSGHRTAESWILHDLLRAGGTDTSARLRELAGQCDSPLVTARARHAAARGRDARELAAASRDFEALGAMLLAAEAASAAAGALGRSGDQRGAKAALRRSAVLAARCEGAATPGLLRAPAAAVLTAREREIAALAAQGMISRDIAVRLGLSVRTVGNHLQHIYAKLGVASRADLARTLEIPS